MGMALGYRLELPKAKMRGYNVDIDCDFCTDGTCRDCLDLARLAGALAARDECDTLPRELTATITSIPRALALPSMLREPVRC